MQAKDRGRERKVKLPGALFLIGDQAWAWALDKFDRGERQWLSELVGAYLTAPELVAKYTREPDPDQRAAVAAIISGTRKPDRRGRKRGDVDPSRRRSAIERVAEIRRYRDAYMAEIREAENGGKRHPKGWTKDQVRRAFNDAMQACADGFDVTVETLEAWTRPSRGTK